MSLRHSCLVSVSALALSVILVGLSGVTAFGADCGAGVGACSCGDTVVTNTTLGATDPVTSTICPVNGLIVADGVALNLQATIRGSNDGVGILVEEGAQDVTVSRGRIFGFQRGLSAPSSTGGRFFNLEIANNGDGGGIEFSGNDNAIERNTIHNNTSEGITCFTGTGNRIVSNRVEQNDGNGIMALACTDTTIERNVANGNTKFGLDVAGSSNNVVGNKMTGNLEGGLRIEGSSQSVSRNVGRRNGVPFAGDGLFVDAADSAFDRNRLDQNDGFGIRDNSTGGTNTFTQNVCNANALGDSSPQSRCR